MKYRSLVIVYYDGYGHYNEPSILVGKNEEGFVKPTTVQCEASNVAEAIEKLTELAQKHYSLEFHGSPPTISVPKLVGG